jgi:Family of unknown function (DUF5330)
MGKIERSERTPPSMLPARFPPRAAAYAAGDTGFMFFLLRMAFWLGLVLILLPSTSSERAPASAVGPSQAISAASATMGDLRQFCDRQPDACTVGSQVATQLGYRAQARLPMPVSPTNPRRAIRSWKRPRRIRSRPPILCRSGALRRRVNPSSTRSKSLRSTSRLRRSI